MWGEGFYFIGNKFLIEPPPPYIFQLLAVRSKPHRLVVLCRDAWAAPADQYALLIALLNALFHTQASW